jgi:hypothetical protein
MPEIDMGEFSSFEKTIAQIKSEHPKISDYITPWWGDKQTDSGNMLNRGYVIGFRDIGSHAQWRLDYDEVKKLHINWTQEVARAETVKQCYRISSIRPRDDLWDYYISWTRKIGQDNIPSDIKGRLGENKKWGGRYWS